jgi:hypothetical protein
MGARPLLKLATPTHSRGLSVFRSAFAFALLGGTLQRAQGAGNQLVDLAPLDGCASILQAAVYNQSFYSQSLPPSAYFAFEDMLCTSLTTSADNSFQLPLSGAALEAFIQAAAVLVTGWSSASVAAVRADPSLASTAWAHGAVLQYYLSMCQALPVGTMLSIITDQMLSNGAQAAKPYVDCLEMVNDSAIVFR